MLEDPSSGLEVPGAVILEVVQGEGGLRPASEAWLLALQAICGKHGVVLIADEIQCGCGRTGQLLSFDSTSFRPDVICLSKSLSGLGLPLSMLLLRNDLDVWSPGEHSGTFRANNLAVATGARALRFWLDPIFTAQVRRNTIALVDRLAAFEARWPGTKRVGTGLMSGLAISAPGAAERVAKGAFEAGVILETCGPRNEVLKFFPPINIDEDELEHGLNLIGRAIDATIKQSEFVG
jgi:diaminobutyrate-2-oxoglutarate transaminase